MNKYNKKIKEFVRVRLEQTPNNTQIARDVKNKFGNNAHVNKKELDHIRKDISYFRKRVADELQMRPQKRLFFDIETGYYILKIRTWQLKNWQRYFNHDDIEREKEIICISYKWQHEEQVHTLDWRMGEKKMLKAFVKIMGEADEIIGHNGDRFDLPFIRTRCLYHGVLIFPNYRTLDTLKKSRSRFMFASNKLDYLGKFMGIGGKQDHEGFEMWRKIVEDGDQEALTKMIEYCERDVVMLEDVYFVLSPFIDHNNNFAVLRGGQKWHCPECTSSKVKMFRTYTTAMGVVRREMKCDDCKKQYRVSNKTYMEMLSDEFRKDG